MQPLTYYPDDSVEGWLGNLGVGWGNIAPEKVPYYLLIVGAPEPDPVPIRTDARRGVLRRPARPSGCRRLPAIRPQRVIDYEKAGTIENKKEIVYFGTRHPFDDATTLSADWLVTPLADGLPARPPSDAVRPVANEWAFAQRKFVGDDARRQALLDVLTPADKRPPAMLLHRDARNGLAERPRAAASGAGRAALPGLGRLRRHGDGPLPGRGRRSRTRPACRA